jgi:phosphoribosylamine--glycine ligase
MNVLPLLSTDLGGIVACIPEGSLSSADVAFSPAATVCKYIVPAGYPDAPDTGDPLTLGDTAGAQVYYANVEERDGRLYTLTSRTLAFVGIGPSLEQAEQAAEQAASGVAGRVRHRKDIGTATLLSRRCEHMRSLR